MKRKFTMIELFILICIIATLAALIVPVPTTHRAKAKIMKCKANLKQIHSEVLLYQNEKSDLLPFLSKNSAIESADYLNLDDSLIICPTEGVNSYFWQTNEFSGKAESPLAADSVKHQIYPFIFTVYQDGHVE